MADAGGMFETNPINSDTPSNQWNDESSELAGPNPAPVKQVERIQSIDVLRGFALLGILVMNIQFFSMPMAAYMNPTAYGDLTGINYWVWHISHLFTDLKMMAIFSMLFGAGIVLMTGRTEAKNKSSAGVHYRRMFFLLLFGLVHAYLLWMGDILTLYAVCGFWLYLFRRLWPSVQLILGVVLLPVVTVGMLGGAWYFSKVEHELERRQTRAAETSALIESDQASESHAQEDTSETDPVGNDETQVEEHDVDPLAGDDESHPAVAGMTFDELDQVWSEQVKSWSPDDEQVAKEVKAMTTSYWAELKFRVPQTVVMQIFMIFFFGTWRAGGLMLIGMALYKWGIFSAARSTATYVAMAVLGFAVGIPLIEMGIAQRETNQWELIDGLFISSAWNYYGSVFVALAWVGVIMLVCKHGVLNWLRTALSAVGQMALSNYLLHTIICTTLFYGRSGLGFAWFGELERWEQALVVASVWLFQLIVSPIWLHYFRFGPFEWLWRSLTYFNPQSMRRHGKQSHAG